MTVRYTTKPPISDLIVKKAAKRFKILYYMGPLAGGSTGRLALLRQKAMPFALKDLETSTNMISIELNHEDRIYLQVTGWRFGGTMGMGRYYEKW